MKLIIRLYSIPLHLQDKFTSVLKETSNGKDFTIHTDTTISVLSEDDAGTYSLTNALRKLICSFKENKNHELAILSYNTFTMLLVHELCKYNNIDIQLYSPKFFRDEQGNIVFKDVNPPKENMTRLVFTEDMITGLEYLKMLQEINTGKV